MFKVDNAIIMAAGTSSRFAPISYEKPKALVSVRGEILIERQIRQLKEVGVNDIYIVTGYKAEDFEYLKTKYNVKLIHNSEYLERNNNSSVYAAKNVIKNSFICSSDNYFMQNPFESSVSQSYYANVFANGKTDEWCVKENSDGLITNVKIGGENSWYMLGHVFWSEEFSKKFINILESEYDRPETVSKYWEDIFIEHINELKLYARHYDSSFIFEFDSLEELRLFDSSYENNSGSVIMRQISKELNCSEKEVCRIKVVKDCKNIPVGFKFTVNEKLYFYKYSEMKIREENNEKK